MARFARVDVGNEVYHVLNRAVGRLQIFTTPADYRLFLSRLREAQAMTDMRILAFTVMPNHWHLQLYPKTDGELGVFMHWLTNAHTRRVHSLTHTVGSGPLYQGRYKSFLAGTDTHMLTVLKYIERNPVRAGLVERVEDWPWGSGWLRINGSPQERALLAEPPIPLPSSYLQWVNDGDHPEDLARLRSSVNKGTPFGNALWVEQMVQTYHLQKSTRAQGRPKLH